MELERTREQLVECEDTAYRMLSRAVEHLTEADRLFDTALTLPDFRVAGKAYIAGADLLDAGHGLMLAIHRLVEERKKLIDALTCLRPGSREDLQKLLCTPERAKQAKEVIEGAFGLGAKCRELGDKIKTIQARLRPPQVNKELN